jgi:serine protease Do
MMKKLIVVCIVFLSLLNAGLLDKQVKFKHADTQMQRKTPAHKDFLLSYNSVLEDIRSSVVNISTEKNVQMNRGGFANPFFDDPVFREFFKGFGDPGLNIPQERIQRSLGSGVIISEEGYIMTNNHVVEGADKIKVSIFGKKKEYDAELIGTDAKSDLAVIKIDAKDLNAITFYDSEKVRIGDVVFALGNPFGVGETITQGIVSATGRSSVGIVEYENFIQTDASINPGNSGGALVNSAGYLIGINSAIISRSGGNVGIGFAIPSNMVENIGKAIIEDGKVTRAYLGVGISDISDELSSFYGKKFGALVTSVETGTPAEKMGLKRGDLIVAVNGKEIDSSNALRNLIGSMSPGTVVKIKFLRNKTVHEESVKLQGPSAKGSFGTYGYEYEGMHVEPVTPQIRNAMGLSTSIQGVYVSKIKAKSEAEQRGIRKGDVVIQVEDEEISDVEAFIKAVRGFGKKRIYLYRRGMILAVAL